jgi:hypothetical protein
MNTSLIKSSSIPIAITLIVSIIYYMFKHEFDVQIERIKYIIYYYFLRIKNILF